MTTDNSRADALTDLLKSIVTNLNAGLPGIALTRAETALELLAASPPSQPAAAPIDGQICQHCDCIRPLHDLDCPVAVEGMKPAPSPADERAAFEIVGATAALRECVDAAEAWRIISDAEDADDIDPVERTMAASRRVAAFDSARKLLADRVSSTDETVPKWVFNDLVNTLQPAWDYIQTHQEQFNARAGDDKNAILVEFFLRAASANETAAAVGWAWISPTGHISRFTVDFDGKHDQLVTGWKVRPVAFCDSAANETGAEGVAIPAGWKLVPIEPTVSMLVDGFESWPDPIFSTPEEWGAFEKMTGCQQATHKARLCYSAMLAAAPQPAQASYDGNHVENHCPECSQYESECECAQADARVGLTDEQIAHVAAAHTNSVVEFDRLLKFARALLQGADR